MTQIDHSTCTHPRTSAGRRACRAGVDSRGKAFHESRMNEMGEGAPPVAVKLRTRPERIQPRRSGARVAIDASGCVQAALHTGRGKCACGWENWNAA